MSVGTGDFHKRFHLPCAALGLGSVVFQAGCKRASCEMAVLHLGIIGCLDWFDSCPAASHMPVVSGHIRPLQACLVLPNLRSEEACPSLHSGPMKKQHALLVAAVHALVQDAKRSHKLRPTV